jgi:hypothetical protein
MPITVGSANWWKWSVNSSRNARQQIKWQQQGRQKHWKHFWKLGKADNSMSPELEETQVEEVLTTVGTTARAETKTKAKNANGSNISIIFPVPGKYKIRFQFPTRTTHHSKLRYFIR